MPSSATLLLQPTRKVRKFLWSVFLCSKLPPVFSVLPRPAGSLLLVSSIGQRQKGVTLTVGRVTAFRLPLASRSDDEPLFSLTRLEEKGKLGFALAYSSKFGVLALLSPAAALFPLFFYENGCLQNLFD